MVLLWLLLGCPSDGVLSPGGASSSLDARGALEARGFVVQDGALVFSTMEGCCEAGANCWGNNPSTPYGAYALPPAEGFPARDDALLEAFGPLPEGLSRDFLLREDEAVVWLGTMPPAARYFGFRSYLGERPGVSHPVIGSLGPSLNHLVVGQQRGEGSVWGEPLAVVTSADQAVEASVIEGLVESGWDPDHISVDRIPPSVAHLGLDPSQHDTLFTILRVAVYDDPAAGAAWEASPGTVWRVTPQVAGPAEAPHPVPELASRGSGADESGWSDAWLALSDAIEAQHGGPRSVLEPITAYWAETIECIDSTRSCTGDIRDRYVGISPYFTLPTPESYLVAYGVNHERTGKATYASVSLQTIENQRGITAFDSSEMVGSARPYLQHADVDDLFVMVFARDCTPHAGPCYEVPDTCPAGGDDEVFKITARAYLEPSTGAAPVPEEMLADMVMLVIPEAP